MTIKRTLGKLLVLLLSIVLAVTVFTACGGGGDNSCKNHSVTKVEARAATCALEGNSEFYTCASCGKCYSDAEGKTEIAATSVVIAKTAHSYNEGVVTTQPTETTEGVKTFTCTVCNATKTETVPVVSHTHSPVKTEAKAATCTEDGNSAYWSCSGCGKYFSDELATTEIELSATVISKVPHTWNEGVVTTQPTETTEGVKTFTCTACNATKTETVPVVGHTHTFATTWEHDATNHWHAATCTHTNEKSDVAPHTWDAGVVTTQPTETAEGVKTFTCTVCDATKTEVVQATGHILVKTEAKAATCTENGNTAYWSCSGCGKYFADENGENEVEQEDTVIAASHTLTYVEEVENTCTTAGNIAHYTCDVCHKLFADAAAKNELEEDEVIVAASHDARITEPIQPDCKNGVDGRMAYWYCEDCGLMFRDEECTTQIQYSDIVIPYAHRWDDGEVTVEPTETEPGTTLYTCDECGLTKEVPIAPVGHTHSLTPNAGEEATCDTTGIKAHWTCDSCGMIFLDAEGENAVVQDDLFIAALGHTMSLVEGKEVTCTENGIAQHYECSVCNKLFYDYAGNYVIDDTNSVIMEAKGHYIEAVEARDATCLEEGCIAHYECGICGELFADELGEEPLQASAVFTPAKGHAAVQKVDAVAATCTTAGNIEYYYCPDCDSCFTNILQTNAIRKASTIIPRGHTMENGKCTVCDFELYYANMFSFWLNTRSIVIKVDNLNLELEIEGTLLNVKQLELVELMLGYDETGLYGWANGSIKVESEYNSMMFELTAAIEENIIYAQFTMNGQPIYANFEVGYLIETLIASVSEGDMDMEQLGAIISAYMPLLNDVGALAQTLYAANIETVENALECIMNILFTATEGENNITTYTLDFSKIGALNEDLATLPIDELLDKYIGENAYNKLCALIEEVLGLKVKQVPEFLAARGLTYDEFINLVDTIVDVFMKPNKNVPKLAQDDANVIDIDAILYDSPYADMTINQLIPTIVINEEEYSALEAFRLAKTAYLEKKCVYDIVIMLIESNSSDDKQTKDGGDPEGTSITPAAIKDMVANILLIANQLVSFEFDATEQGAITHYGLGVNIPAELGLPFAISFELEVLPNSTLEVAEEATALIAEINAKKAIEVAEKQEIIYDENYENVVVTLETDENGTKLSFVITEQSGFYYDVEDAVSELYNVDYSSSKGYEKSTSEFYLEDVPSWLISADCCGGYAYDLQIAAEVYAAKYTVLSIQDKATEARKYLVINDADNSVYLIFDSEESIEIPADWFELDDNDCEIEFCFDGENLIQHTYCDFEFAATLHNPEGTCKDGVDLTLTCSVCDRVLVMENYYEDHMMGTLAIELDGHEYIAHQCGVCGEVAFIEEFRFVKHDIQHNDYTSETELEEEAGEEGTTISTITLVYSCPDCDYVYGKIVTVYTEDENGNLLSEATSMYDLVGTDYVLIASYSFVYGYSDNDIYLGSDGLISALSGQSIVYDAEGAVVYENTYEKVYGEGTFCEYTEYFYDGEGNVIYAEDITCHIGEEESYYELRSKGGCQYGVNKVYFCTDCGETIDSDYYTSNHVANDISLTTIDLTQQYGFCEGSYIKEGKCLCGQEDICEIVIACADNQGGYDEDGIFWETCPVCHQGVSTKQNEPVQEGCYLVSSTTYSFKNFNQPDSEPYFTFDEKTSKSENHMTIYTWVREEDGYSYTGACASCGIDYGAHHFYIDWAVETSEFKLVEQTEENSLTFEFTPNESGEYRFYSENWNRYDPAIVILDADLDEIDKSDDAINLNFDVTVELEQGVTYYIQLYDYDSPEGGGCLVYVEFTPIQPEAN